MILQPPKFKPQRLKSKRQRIGKRICPGSPEYRAWEDTVSIFSPPSNTPRIFYEAAAKAMSKGRQNANGGKDESSD